MGLGAPGAFLRCEGGAAVSLCSMYIDLERTFRELRSTGRPGEDLQPGDLVPSIAHLLAQPRVVVLAEGGSGKTYELQQAARLLRAGGYAAFFLRLENVVRDFEIAFEEGSIQEFDAWLDSNERGWLLLDSIDESRLRSPMEFHDAVRKVRAKIAQALDRVHIVMTGRPAAWQHEVDLALCDRLFPLRSDARLSPGSDLPTAFKIVRLEVLDSARVERYARGKGVQDFKAFMQEIERAEAGSFTQRPLDLEELVEFWTARGRIGSRYELMTDSVERRLRETADRGRSLPLEPTKAVQGAQLLAGALALAREQNIQVPGGGKAGPGLSPREVLDWNDTEIAALLQRPIFDPGAYGAVRFHHGSVREFLAAQWFLGLLKRDVSRRRVEELFFRENYGVQVVVPSLRPLLPWIAMSDIGFLRRVKEVAPEVLFEGGDPLQLDAKERGDIVRRACEHLARGVPDQTWSSFRAAERFADKDLADCVRGLAREYSGRDVVAGFLMAIIKHGRISQALPEAISLALSPTVDIAVRLAAFNAVAAAGTPQDMASVRSAFATGEDPLDRRCMVQLLRLIEEPEDADLQWLVDCAPRIAGNDPFDGAGLANAMAEFLQRLDMTMIPAAIDKLCVLLLQPPFADRSSHYISLRNVWLLRPISVVLFSLVKARHEHALRPGAIAALRLLLLDVHYHPATLGVHAQDVASLVQEWPRLKWATYWTIVDGLRVGQQRVEYSAAAFQMVPMVWVERDFESAIAAIAEREHEGDRGAALSIAYRLYARGDRAPEQRTQLLQAVKGSDVLELRLQELEAADEDSAQAQQMGQRNANEGQSRASHEELARKQRLATVERVRSRPDLLREVGGQMLGDEQLFMYLEMGRLEQHSHTRGRYANWRRLVPEFGEEAAVAFRDGIVGYWRTHAPTLLSEGAYRNDVPIQDEFGLTGLTIEVAETPGLTAALLPAEAQVACRYAMRAIGGFPTWFPALFAAHCEDLTRMLFVEVEFELAIEDWERGEPLATARIRAIGPLPGDHVAQGLLEMLSSRSPPHLKLLEDMVAIVQASNLPGAAIAQVAREKMQAGDSAHRALWAAAWTSVEPGPAIDAMVLHLASLANANLRTEFVMAFVVRLLGSRHRPSSMRSEYRSAAALKRLYLLVHEHVHTDEDIDRSGGGVFTPGPRDDAQDARERLVQMLQDIPGRDTYTALRSLAKELPHAGLRAWLEVQALARAKADSERPPWNGRQVREFADSYERDPANHRELFDLAVMRLIDLQHETEDGDQSIASMAILVDQETILRNWIASWCRRLSHGRFDVAQEEEKPDAKRTDLRWICSTFEGPVPTELKIADNWSGPELVERLENQLVGDYLRDDASTCGIYLLVWRGTKKSWDLRSKPKNRVDFEGLIEALQRHWDSVARDHPGVDEIKVIGIDLTKRGGRAPAPAGRPRARPSRRSSEK